MELKTTGDWYLIRRDVEDERTKGGLIRPDTARRPLPRGVVIQVGDEIRRKLSKGEIEGPRVGDYVFFPDAAAWDVEIEGEPLTGVHYGDITAWKARKEA